MPRPETTPPTILWLRRDLRLDDHPGWQAALSAGGPILPVFVLDPQFEGYGAAPKWRLGESLRVLGDMLDKRGSGLILRRGPALEVLRELVAETGARTVVWSRQYDATAIARDTEIKSALSGDGLEVTSVNASLLFEPWTAATGAGGMYKVYTPFWKAVRDRDVSPPLPAPADLAAPATWPASDALDDWALGKAMNRGAAIVARHAVVGEDAARQRLGTFLDAAIARYKSERDFPARHAVSGLSENLAYGEISPRTLWHAGQAAMQAHGAEAEHFLKEVVWREFAYHLLYHTPEIETRNWRPEWDSFPWEGDNDAAERWHRGLTGIEMVDAAMREMYVTGTMHNRTRMLAASFLTKHLMTDWRIGAEWFRQCLIDWDPASNALGWQWTAGSGPDAAPYFRIFNPDTQAERFDPDGRYRDRFLAHRSDHEDARAFFDAVPRAWGISSHMPYPSPVIGLADGRTRALAAYKSRDKAVA